MQETDTRPLWLDPIEQPAAIAAIVEKFGCHPVVAQVLLNRGLFSGDQSADLKEMAIYLNPHLDDLYDPFLLADMDVAIARITRALQEQEHVLIHGDYDADGITSASLLVRGLKTLGFQNVSFFVPHRMEDGYGVSLAALELAKEKGAGLLITCDCGISSQEAVARANELGLDVIVTDHHEVPEQLPPALAVINPKRKDCAYPFKELAGVGVAFKLLQALGVQEELMDLLTMGTIADVVPLISENRVIVKAGLKRMQQSQNEGIRSLLKVAELEGKEFSAGDVGFKVTPRINAIGRLGDPTDGLRMLVTDKQELAYQIALKLDEENQKRKQIEQAISKQAQQQVENNAYHRQGRVLVLYQPEWHPGVIGIVASRMVEKYHRPAILIAAPDEQGICKASCRSIETFHILNGLNACSDYLEGFGGHAYAAGFSIAEQHIDPFRQAINQYAAKSLSEEDLRRRFRIDANVTEEQVNDQLHQELAVLEPFGAQNPRPLLRSVALRFAGMPKLLGGEHLKFSVYMNNEAVDCIAFKLGNRFGELYQAFKGKKSLDLLYTLSMNEWKGRRILQLAIKDLRVV